MSKASGGDKTALVISKFFNERYGNIQQLSDKIRADCRKRPLAPATAYSKRRRSRSYCRYHPRRDVSLSSSLSQSQSSPMVKKNTKKSSRHHMLLTHKWHAKRFHMMKRWGCVLPRAHMHRGRQFLWNALKTECVIHDQSYMVPIVLTGPLESGLKSMLSRLLDPLQAQDIFENFTKQRCDTLVEQKLCLYEDDCFPRHCLGPVSAYITCDSENLAINQTENVPMQLWMWVHPAILPDVVTALHSARDSLPPLVADSVQLPTIGEERTCVGGFGRFSIVGTAASELLRRVLKPRCSVDSCSFPPIENGLFFESVLQSEGINSLWKHNEGLAFEAVDCRELSFHENGFASIRDANPYRTWNSLDTPAVTGVSNGNGIGKCRRAKRLTKPRHPVPPSFFKSAKECVRFPDEDLCSLRQQQRKGAYRFGEGETEGSITQIIMHNDTSNSEKWSCVQRTGKTEGDDDKRDTALSFPVLLIRKCQTTESDHQGDGCDLPLCLRGWDIIVPDSHCSSLWLALNMAGGRSIGSEERSVVDSAARIPVFPRDYPDTVAGNDYWKSCRRVNHIQSQRRPLRKRKQNKKLERVPNLKRLFDGITGPESMTDLVVMRNKQFAEPFFPKDLLLSRKLPREFSISAAHLKCIDADCNLDMTDFPPPVLPFSTLIRVYISSSGRGVPQCGAELFQPTHNDYMRWLDHRQHRTAPTTTNNRKLGDWVGPPRSERNERILIGLVSTTLQPDISQPEKCGIAFCEVGKMSQMVSVSSQMILSKRGQVVPLVMFRNPLSDIIRPALFELLLC